MKQTVNANLDLEVYIAAKNKGLNISATLNDLLKGFLTIEDLPIDGLIEKRNNIEKQIQELQKSLSMIHFEIEQKHIKSEKERQKELADDIDKAKMMKASIKAARGYDGAF